jgi:hypothetical protein
MSNARIRRNLARLAAVVPMITEADWATHEARGRERAREECRMYETNGETQMSEQDPSEYFRRVMLATGQPQRDLETATDRWTTEELIRDFTVEGFMAPFVVVTRKSDGVKGSLEFTHSPRVYFNFKAT